jgi:hypothetical protein
MPRLSIMFLCLMTGMSAAGQFVNAPKPVITGVLVEDSTQRVIPYAHIYNESKRTGDISDEEGRFKIKADIGDTLVITAVGYLGRTVMAGDLWIDSFIKIYLTPRLYEIEAVQIRAFKDYADFQRQFAALELSKTQTQLLKENLAQVSAKAAKKAEYENNAKEVIARNNEGTILYYAAPIKSRDDLRHENYDRLLRVESKQHIIDKKYNREIIYNITRLTEDEITDFMGFCNFNMDYLFNATEYEIMVKIEEKFREYLAKKSSGELLDDEMKNRLYAEMNVTF